MSFPVFIVGSPRSGTTLLRSMLDSHPNLAIPPESHFVVALWTRRLGLRDRPEAALEAVIAHPRFARWGLDPDTLRASVRSAAPSSYVELMTAIFSTYAQAHGKPRWGDKTPLYGLHMPLLATMFPDAKFVHIIRDGRNVAASLAAGKPGGSQALMPGHGQAPTAVTSAFWWRSWMRRIRHNGTRVGPDRYLEIRYERLVADPAQVLTEVCRFIDEDFHPAMLDYPQAVESGATRLNLASHPNLLLEPKVGIRNWRTSVPAAQHRHVEAVLWRQLDALGYATDNPGRWASARAWWMRAVGLSHTWRSNAERVLHPATKSL